MSKTCRKGYTLHWSRRTNFTLIFSNDFNEPTYHVSLFSTYQSHLISWLIKNPITSNFIEVNFTASTGPR